MTTRRRFIKQSLIGTAAISLPIVSSCTAQRVHAPKISLAQWSLNRAFRKGELQAIDFAAITRKDYGLDAVEYVNSFYAENKNNQAFWADMQNRAEGEGVESLLIMVDAEGELGNANDAIRLQAVDNHKTWVDIAAQLGCHSIRVNAFGDADRAIIKRALVDGLGRLCEYSETADIHVIIENHGLYSSDADFVIEVVQEINNPYMGTLPDFGNWCTSVQWGGTRDDSCEYIYDLAKGVELFMPYAKGVSAKTYDFNEAGGQDRIDYINLLQIVKNHNYSGYIGIEYEGENLSEPDGIKATQNLIERTWSQLV